MKIAYLLQIRENHEQAGHIISALSTYDDVFVSFYDEKSRNDLKAAFKSNSNVHFSEENYPMMVGDLSRPRIWLLLLIQALSTGNYCAYINIDEFTCPLVSRDSIIEFFRKSPNVDYVQATHEDQLPDFRNRMQLITIGTNDLGFKEHEWFRNNCYKFGKFLRLIGIKRKRIPFDLYQGPSWFVLSHPTAQLIADQMQECSGNFVHSWFSEEVYFQSVIHKYGVNVQNECCTYLSPAWKTTIESVSVHPDEFEHARETKLFANKVVRSEYPEIFDEFIANY